MASEPIKMAGKKAVPVEAGLFTMPESPADRPRLIASKCKLCGEVLFPQRMSCLKCTGMDMEQVLLSTVGKLYSFTVTRQAPPGSVVKPPYVLASIEMPQGVNVHTVLTDCDLDKLQIGMDMEMVVETIRQDEAGRDVVAYKFRPA